MRGPKRFLRSNQTGVNMNRNFLRNLALSLVFSAACGCYSIKGGRVKDTTNDFEHANFKRLAKKYSDLDKVALEFEATWQRQVTEASGVAARSANLASEAAKASQSAADESLKAVGDAAKSKQGKSPHLATASRRAKEGAETATKAASESAKAVAAANEVVAAASKAVAAAGPTEAARLRHVRNEMLRELLWMVDYTYDDYKKQLHNSHATFGFLSDMAILGTSSAGAIVGGEALKAILATASAGVVGARNSVSQNFYREQSIEIIIGKMDTLRATIRLGIERRFSEDLDTYSLRQGFLDIRSYFDQGSVVTALVVLSQEVAPKAQEAAKTLKEYQDQMAGNPKGKLETLIGQLESLPADKRDAACLALSNAMAPYTEFQTLTADTDKKDFKKVLHAINAFQTNVIGDKPKLELYQRLLIEELKSALRSVN